MVLLTDLNAAALEEGLLTVLAQLSTRHQVMVAAVADGDLRRYITAGGKLDDPVIRAANPNPIAIHEEMPHAAVRSLMMALRQFEAAATDATTSEDAAAGSRI